MTTLRFSLSKFLLSKFLLSKFLLTLLAFCLLLLGAIGGAGAANYYVNTSGNDANPGSQAQPWATLSKVNAATLAPGDTVSFQGGQSWSGTLTLSQSGTLGNPITVQSYGGGQAAISGGTSPAVTETNQSYLTLTNLSLSSSAPSTSNVGGNTSGTVTLSVTTTSGHRYPGVTVAYCTITGGQYGIYAQVPDTAQDGFDGLSVSHDTITAASNFGAILLTPSNAMNRQNNCANTYFGYNTVSGITGTTAYQGSGLVMGYTTTGIIEYNYVHDCGASTANQNAGSAGTFPISCSGIITQYNEVARISAGTASVDGVGCDIDLSCTSCTMQYNYVHDCGGSALLCIASSGSGCVIRWNLCINNSQTRVGDALVRATSGAGAVYNNTVVNTFDYPTTGIQVNDTGCKVLNNLVEVGHGGNSMVLQSGQTVAGNCYRSGGGFQVSYAGTTYTSLAAFRAASGQEVGTGTTANPLLASPLTDPEPGGAAAIPSITALRPTQASPLLGAGVSLTGFGVTPGPSDLSGATLPGSGFPIGAFLATASPGFSRYDLTVLNDIPQLFWGMQESSGVTATDTGTAGNSGTYHVATLGQPGYSGSRAVSFSSSASSYLGDSGAFTCQNNTALSVELWVKFSAPPTGGQLFSKWSANPAQWLLQVGSDITWAVKGSAGYEVVASSGLGLTTNTWYHIVAVWGGGSSMALYVNNSPVTLTPSSTANNTRLDSSSVPTAVTPGTAATVERAALYASALSSSQVSAHYLTAQASLFRFRSQGTSRAGSRSSQ